MTSPENPRSGSASSSVPTDEAQLLAALTDVLRRKRETLLGDDPLHAPVWMEPIWPPLLDALAQHAARRRAQPQQPDDPAVRQQVHALQQEYDTVLNGLQVWSNVVQRLLDATRGPLHQTYGATAASRHSLGRG